MRTSALAVVSSLASLSLCNGAAAAGLFGSPGNSGAVDDTGKPAYGFEIDIEDPSFDPYEDNQRLRPRPGVPVHLRRWSSR
jgi:hypothetical protein